MQPNGMRDRHPSPVDAIFDKAKEAAMNSQTQNLSSDELARRTIERRAIVAIGDCGCTGGIFGESYASCGRVSNVIPVDIAVPGCPPTPTAIMQGILTAISPGLGRAAD
jgi:Ni,Fe-hydrogenase III small subunit